MHNNFEAFYEEVLKEKFDFLEKKYKRIFPMQKYILPLCILLVLSMGYLIYIVGKDDTLWEIVLSIGFAALAVSLIIKFLNHRDEAEFGGYRWYFKHQVIETIVTFINPHTIYHRKKSIAKKDFVASLIFDFRFIEYSGEDLFYGKSGQTPFWFSEIWAYYTRKVKEDIFKGLFFIADFNKYVNSPLLICPDGQNARKDVFPNHSRVKNFENQLFENEFSVYCKDGLTARYVLTPGFMSRILKLKSIVETQISISIVGSYIYMAFSFHDGLFEPPKKKSEINFEKALEIYNFLKQCIDTIEQLDLNTRIWTKE